MFALLLIKFNQLSIRTRLLAGLSVGLILILLASIAYYKAFCYDDLSRYTSKNTQVYFHLDNRSTPDNFYKIKVTDALLKPFGLSDLNRHLIGSELAVVCDNFSNELDCGLIIQARQAAGVNKYLTDKHIVFRQLDPDIFIVSPRGNWLKTVKKSINPFRYLRYQSTVGHYGSLTMVFNQPSQLTDEISKASYLVGLNGSAKFSGAIANSGITIRTASLRNAFSFGSAKFSSENSVSTSCDVFINSKNNSISKTLNSYIFSLFTGITSSTDATSFLNRHFGLCMNKTGSTGDLIKDYDVLIKSDQQLDDPDIKTLETILLNLASYSEPEIKTSYLNDGTKIIELKSAPENLSFINASGTRSIGLNGDKSLYYSNTASGLIISDKIGLDKASEQKFSGDYLSVRINSMPAGQIKDILSAFSYLSASQGQMTIK